MPITRDEIIRDNPLLAHLTRLGCKILGSGNNRKTNRCAVRAHKPEHWCVDIEATKQIWYCHSCKQGGSIIDWLMHERGKSVSEIIRSFNEDEPTEAKPTGDPRIVMTYDYVNESGELKYQVVRMEPKSFRQRQPNGSGGWNWTMEGATRILFHLPQVLQATCVVVVEGEKDANTLETLGYVSTCNVGGAGKWIPAYSDCLKGKDVIVIPDNDTPGRKHGDLVVKSLEGKCASLKTVIVPEPYKDVTEFVESFPEQETAARELTALIEKSAHTLKPIPIYTIQEMEVEYREFMQRKLDCSFDLGKFLPELGQRIRPMVPGEMLLLLADTGVGKTILLQRMLRAAKPLQSLLFEMELPNNLVFERFVQMEANCYSSDVQQDYKDHSEPLWKGFKGLHHIAVCPESGLSTEQIESYIVRSELKTGKRPIVVAVDYVGLINQKMSKGRYEAVSKSAEELKVIAKRTNTIILVSAQIARPDKKKENISISLHDAKDSGSLECSAGIVIGAWRPEKNRIMLRILKNTSGTSGDTIEAEFDGAKVNVTSL